MGWENNVVGGVGTPRIHKLEDNNRILNGSFETALGSEWTNTIIRTLASGLNWAAPKGDYIGRVDSAGQQAVDYGADLANTSWIVTMKIRQVTADAATAVIKLGTTAAGSGTLNNPTTVTVKAPADYWRTVYLVLDLGACSDNFVHLVLSSSGGYTYFDDVRMYKIQDTYNFDHPQKYEQPWSEEIESEFQLIDGKNRKVSKGWRYSLNMTYDFVSAEAQAEIIRVTENGLNFVIPHIDSLFGSLMRWEGNFANNYFFDRYLGHSTIVSLKAIELENDKPSDIGIDFVVS